MTLLQLKQIKGVFSSYVAINGFSANGGSDVVTTEVTSSLLTAGRGGGAVPLQVSANDSASGIPTASPANRVEIYDGTTKLKIADMDGNEVYGRLTEAAGVYTLTYFVLAAGVETAHSFSAATTIDLNYVYRYEFDDLPGDFATNLLATRVSEDPSSSAGGTIFYEEIAVTAADTLDDLTKTPVTGAEVILHVNGKTESSAATTPPFTYTGLSLTWNPTNAMYNLAVTDIVIAQYNTNE